MYGPPPSIVWLPPKSMEPPLPFRLMLVALQHAATVSKVMTETPTRMVSRLLSGNDEGDMAVFTLTLANLPNIVPVEDAKDQKIAVSGMVTLTGGGDDAPETMFGIASGSEVTYETPNIDD